MSRSCEDGVEQPLAQLLAEGRQLPHGATTESDFCCQLTRHPATQQASVVQDTQVIHLFAVVLLQILCVSDRSSAPAAEGDDSSIA